jgi:hypothetical protein
MIPPISPSDLQTAWDATKLFVWAGKQLKAWVESRQPGAAEAKAKPARKAKRRDVAIVVRISRLNVEDVRAFLAARKIDADLVVISNSPSDQVVHLPNDAEAWEELVREFYAAFTKIQAETGARRFHLFLAAPAALGFAMGCTMSTLYDVHLYQWDPDRQTYVEIIRGTSRNRLMAPVKEERKS